MRTEGKKEPGLDRACSMIAASAGRPEELVDLVDRLEHSLRQADALGLTLVGALLDHCIAEARRCLTS
jgi:hypothetical protein